MLHEHALGVFQTQHRDPFPERGVVSRLDVIGQIGPVGPEFLGQLLDGESRLCESVPVEPECEFRRNGEVPDRRGILAVGEIRIGLAFHFGFEDALHLFVEEQVVHVRAEEVDVEGDRGEDPQKDVAFRQEGQHSAPDAVDDGPVGEDREPADIGGDVVRVEVVDYAHGLPVGAYEPPGEAEGVDEEPDGHDQQSDELGDSGGHQEQHDGRHAREEQPSEDVPQEAVPAEVVPVEQRSQGRAE